MSRVCTSIVRFAGSSATFCGFTRWTRRTHVVMNKQTHESGQATTEYALVLLAAAVIALLVIAWATNGEGASRIGDMFNQVFDNIMGRAQSFG